MFRFLFFSVIICTSFGQSAYAQNPSFSEKISDGLGSYGFIEKDAFFFSVLNRDQSADTKSLSVRHTLISPNGATHTIIQQTSDQNGWQCSGDQSLFKKTNPITIKSFGADAVSGSKLYSGIFKTDCKDVVTPDSQVGYDEIVTEIIDIQTQYHPNLSEAVLADNSKYLVGAFKIVAGNSTELLTQLRIINKGTATEGDVISNEAFKIYYEPISAAFRFDGDETYGGTLFGDDAGDATNNNIYQNSQLSIPLGKGVWIYVVMQINSDLDLAMMNKDDLTISLAIANDGLSITQQGSDRSLVRIDEINISENKSIPLPLKWISFDGWERKNSVLLQWVTSSELNVDHFMIDACLDKVNWINIGKVHVNGNPGNTYAFEDQRNIRGINYYRILQVDKSGETSLSKIVAVKKVDRKRYLVYPNNTNNILSVTNELGERFSGPIEVFDVNGKKYKLNSSNETYSVTQLHSGVYFVQIGDEFLKFIKY